MTAMIKISFLGNDDFDFKGFTLTTNKGDILAQIKEKVEEDFESYGITIYHSDNEGTPFDSAEDVMDTISVVPITQEEYDTIQKLVGTSYGSVPSFLEV